MLKRNKDEIDKSELNDIIHLSKKILKVVYVVVIVGIILGILLAFKQLKLFKVIGDIFSVLAPLIIGFIIAWLFYPLHKKITNKGINKVLSALIIFLLIVGFITLFFYLFIPILYDQINDLIGYIPDGMKSVTKFLSNTLDKIDINGIDLDSVKKGIITSGEKMVINFTTTMPDNLLSFIKGFVSTIGTIFISLVVGIYMLIDFEDLSKRFFDILPKKNHRDYVELFKNIGDNARRVVNGTLVVAFVVFILDTIGFAIVKLNGSALFGLLCGVTDLIPYIGPYIGGAAAVIVGFTQSPIIGIEVLIVAVIVQGLENYILQPVVMSKAMQLHPIIIIVGLLLFGYFFGILGMVIATPCIAIIKEIVIFIQKRLNYKEETE